MRISMLTDSESLFNVMVRSSRITEKWLMIEIAAAQAVYDNGEIDDIGWLPTRNNIADAFIKIGGNNRLKGFMDTGFFMQMSQWVIRCKDATTNEGIMTSCTKSD